MSSYTVTFADSTTTVRARKDAAIAVGEKSGQDFTITSKSGAVVHTHQTPAEAPAPADNPTTEETPVATKTETSAEKPAPAAKTGTVVVYHQPRKRSKFFFTPMAEAGVRLAEQQGLTAEVDKEALGVRVTSGGKRAITKFEKDVNLMWDTAYEDFKGYKKENKDVRREQMKSRDGIKVMCDAEHVWFGQRLDAYLEAQDVL
jgi:hypothetical protein